METIFDEWYKIKCNQCAHCNNCPKWEGLNLEPYRPWFKCMSDGFVCRSFVPADYCVWLKNHWTSFDHDTIPPKETEQIAMFVNGNTDVAYHVLYRDYLDGSWIDDEGNLNWTFRNYYKRTKDGYGYKMVHEFNDGTEKIQVRN